MRFGVLTHPDVAWDELVGRWRYLEELGFDAIYVPDALSHPRDASRRWYDAWVCLATLAQVTERSRIGPLVTSIIFRNPAAVVNAAASIDVASNGRLELALGAGEPSVDHELAEVPIWPSGERRDRFRDYVRRVRSLLDADPRSLSIPLTIAAQAPGTIRVACEMADGWNVYGGRGLSAEEGRALIRQRIGELVRGCSEVGRDPAKIHKSLLLGYGFIAEQPFRSADSFTEVVDAWRAIGIDEIVFFYPPELVAPPGQHVDVDLFERIVREVMPPLRAP
jgi:alkanesulfonate monooxygenase SsuD/methylene tetrahydromethanopterin reductase-like flavin-dependent oxidoreductase (luciferase family)